MDCQYLCMYSMPVYDKPRLWTGTVHASWCVMDSVHCTLLCVGASPYVN
uniref:Uncharacterized protein n=1 Tax=Anguilla anguilla TaxID=7936 RepID=A0A0E9UMC7_ANGAN